MNLDSRIGIGNERDKSKMFDEENEMKNAEEYRVKMESLALDCHAGNIGAISCHHAAEFFATVDVCEYYNYLLS